MTDQAEDLRARLVSMVRPSVAKCMPLTAQQIAKLEEKEAFARLLAELGLDASKCARALDLEESTVRSWLDPRKLTHNPQTWAIRKLGKEARLAWLRIQLDEVQADSNG